MLMFPSIQDCHYVDVPVSGFSVAKELMPWELISIYNSEGCNVYRFDVEDPETSELFILGICYDFLSRKGNILRRCERIL